MFSLSLRSHWYGNLRILCGMLTSPPGGISDFAKLPSTRIWASAHDQDFINGDGRLPTSSLCRFLDIETPKYQVTDWASDAQSVVYEGQDLGLQIFHTPGHTPDELALWDQEERVLF